MQQVPDAIVCEGCDAVYHRAPLSRRQIAKCPRCGTELNRYWGRLHERILPLAVASLVLFVIANAFPIVEIEIKGLGAKTTLVGAVIALATEGMSEVALLVLLTTLLFPLLQLCILLYLLMPNRQAHAPPGFRILIRMMQSLQPWGMIEVFLLGILVAIVKLSSMATVIAGPALWAFIGLTVLLTAVLSFNPRAFWDVVFREPARPGS